MDVRSVSLSDKIFEKIDDEPELRRLAEEMTKLMLYHKCALREVETKFRVLDDQLSMKRERNPISTIKTRLKSPMSIKEKLERLGLPVTLSSAEENLNDIAGIRVICAFTDDVYTLADCLLKQDDVKLIGVKDYIKAPKPNGYRSLHLIIEIPIFLIDQKKAVRVEVQLRTIAMENWANLEHRLRYKKNIPEEKLAVTADMLSECAEMSGMLDFKMQEIRKIIEDE
ncbi:MAG: GTP pyrophosphokinase family protein [Clostridia bacterium]|nr:GTP pyrophosphokinase family protein [Clostridia bacterium]